MVPADVTSRQEVESWILGPLLDAIAPECDYSGKEWAYEPHVAGSINSVNVMFMPLRLQQTRVRQSAECSEPADVNPGHILGNYPLASTPLPLANYTPYPRCASTQRSSEPYGPRVGAFVYTPVTNVALQYEYCGAHNVVSEGQRCYQGDGYILDVWEADRYRSELTSLLDSGWVDDLTESVAIHLQLVNFQTGCMVFTTILFEFVNGGVVHSAPRYQVMCERPGAPTYTAVLGRGFGVTPMLSFNWFDTFDNLTLLLGFLYMVRVTFVQLKAWRKVCLTQSAMPVLTSGYFIDTILGILLLLWLLCILAEMYHIDSMYAILYETRARSINNETVIDIILQTYNELGAAETVASLGEVCTDMSGCVDLAIIGRQALNKAAYLGQFFDGSPYNVTSIDMRYPAFFKYLTPMGDYAAYVAGLRSLVLLVCLIKCARYLQAWRPVAARYSSFVQCLPIAGIFFVLLGHVLMAFIVAGYLMFGYRVYALRSLFVAAVAIVQLMMGRITLAQELINYDSEFGGVNGMLFVFLLMIVGYLTTTSVIVAVLCDAWENSTEHLRRRREQKREMRSLEKMQRDLNEYNTLKAILSDATDLEIIEMADMHFRSAVDAERTAADTGPAADGSKLKRREAREARKARRAARVVGLKNRIASAPRQLSYVAYASSKRLRHPISSTRRALSRGGSSVDSLDSGVDSHDDDDEPHTAAASSGLPDNLQVGGHSIDGILVLGRNPPTDADRRAAARRANIERRVPTAIPDATPDDALGPPLRPPMLGQTSASSTNLNQGSFCSVAGNVDVAGIAHASVGGAGVGMGGARIAPGASAPSEDARYCKLVSSHKPVIKPKANAPSTAYGKLSDDDDHSPPPPPTSVRASTKPSEVDFLYTEDDDHLDAVSHNGSHDSHDIEAGEEEEEDSNGSNEVTGAPPRRNLEVLKPTKAPPRPRTSYFDEGVSALLRRNDLDEALEEGSTRPTPRAVEANRLIHDVWREDVVAPNRAANLAAQAYDDARAAAEGNLILSSHMEDRLSQSLEVPAEAPGMHLPGEPTIRTVR